MAIATRLKTLTTEMFQQLLPRRCELCSDTLDVSNDHGLCAVCKSGLPLFTGAACRVCGLPIDGDLPGAGIVTCGSCRIKKPPFDQTVYPLIYRGKARDLIHHFKFRGRENISKTLAMMISARLYRDAKMDEIDFIIPMPLHYRRLYSRGFNQSYLLASEIADTFSLPLENGILTRTKATDPLSSKTRRERLEHIRKAFSLKRKSAVANRKILLVDDIMTTGATMLEAAKTLKMAGAKSVACAVAARA